MAQQKKRLIGRLIAFIIALIVAVSAFTIGVLQLGRRESGYYDVGMTAEGNVALYGSGIHLIYYADGNSSAIRQRLNEVQKVFTSILLHNYRLLDAHNTYEGYVNIASLNAQPGQPLALGEDLFAVLSDALSRQQQSGAYNLFSGPLHDEWRTLRYLEAPADFDPLVNAEEAALLAEITAAVNGRYALDLTLSAEDRTAALQVDPAYLQWAQAREIDSPLLDLNLLHDAYLVSLTARDLVQRGYTMGYLYAESGVSVTLEQTGEMAYSLYGYAGEPLVLGSVTLPSPSAFCQFSAFSLTNEPYNYYMIDNGQKTALRHPYVDVRSGGYNDVLMTAVLGAERSSLVDLAHHMIELNALPDQAAVEQYLAGLPQAVYAAYTLQADSPPVLYERNGQPPV